jgi:hypothetical protein
MNTLINLISELGDRKLVLGVSFLAAMIIAVAVVVS